MAKTKDGNYFLDTNPHYFQEILDYLRFGEIFTEDKAVLKGVKSLANYFGLIELVREIESESQWITLYFPYKNREPFKILLKNITKFKNSTLAKYFLGDEAAVQLLSLLITKEYPLSESYYSINRDPNIWVHLIKFMEEDQGASNLSTHIANCLISELNLFGFMGYYHHCSNSSNIRWNKL